ncbi:MAG: radical SAM family heme chaperone HemW [bacterium]
MKPFGLYVHVPFCDGKCSYCAFYSIRYEAGLADRYIAAVEKELMLYSGCQNAANHAFDTIYFGGGTPTLLSDRQLERLCAIVSRGRPAPVEWTVEANPGVLTESRLAVLKQAGINRVSLGAQSFDDDILRKLGRRHRVEDIGSAVALVREAGIANVGIDLIACIPGVDSRMWRATLDAALALKPQHISVYALTVEEGTALNEAVRSRAQRVPGDVAQLAFLHTAERVLGNAGYGRYEISNYALPGFECLHNLACWRGAEYVGVGPAASSHVGLRRWTNAGDLTGYLDAIEHGHKPERDAEDLTKVVKATEMVIFGLRMAEGIDTSIVRARSGINAVDEKKLVAVFQGLLESGVVEYRSSSWFLTDRGRDVADYVAVEIIGWENGSPVT